MDKGFQSDAYNSLSDRQKKDLLMNSKLKDELALQNIGLINLTLRLSRQKISNFEIKRGIQKFERRARRLRKKCGDLRRQQNTGGNMAE